MATDDTFFRPGYTVLPDGRVRFVLDAPEASEVLVAADFTHWEKAPIPMRRQNRHQPWTVTVGPLPAGIHFYLFLVDGSWVQDPAHPMEEHNGLWGWNSAFAVHGADVGPPEALRIASLNLHTWQEKNAALKLEQVAWSLAELDVHVVALQEVGEHQADSTQPNAGEFIAWRMARHSRHAYHHVWRFAHIGFDVYREGLSVISRGPIHQVLEAELAIGPLRRIAMLAEIEWNGRRINLCNVHLSDSANGGYEQATQLVHHILPRYTSSDAPSILLADLNAQPHEGTVNLVREGGWHDAASLCVPPGDSSPTFFGEHPHRRIDYQFVKSGIHSGPSLRPVSLHRLYARNALANCYLPEVSDHAGLLGVYHLP